MSTYRELVYLILDEIKGLSDDFPYTEEHIIFLLDKYRAFVLKQRYSDVKKQIPESNFQTICLDLIQVPAISGEACEGGVYLRSMNKIPYLMQIINPKITTTDYFQGDFTYVTRDRMKYVGKNKYLKDIIYASIAPDSYLYFKSSNPQYLGLEKARITGVFQDAFKCAEQDCSREQQCLPIDYEFPLEEALIPVVTDMLLKTLTGAIYKPKDGENNAVDDLSDIARFLRQNLKNGLQKQIES